MESVMDAVIMTLLLFGRRKNRKKEGNKMC